uniref:Uncharacterized protein n=1 Tax=Oryza glumipatula TaxID=40148 RepID=A0A0E0ASF1_9ORYZ
MSKWVLKYDVNLAPLPKMILYESDDVHNESEWNSDDDNIIGDLDESEEKGWRFPKFFDFLGFHPYKEVVYLMHSSGNLECSKVQYLGQNLVNEYNRGMEMSFPYTPCLVDLLPERAHQKCS